MYTNVYFNYYTDVPIIQDVTVCPYSSFKIENFLILIPLMMAKVKMKALGKF